MSKRKYAKARFNYRVAGVCVHDGHVLLHCWEACDFWALPGGRPELLETSVDALIREMREETGLEIAVGRLLWVVENFYAEEGKRIHEVGFYYAMTLPKVSGWNDVTAELTGHEGAMPITFRWFPIDALEDITLYPALLKTALAEIPDSTVHVIVTDPAVESDVSGKGST